jgi:sialate O-acetylesterase
MKNFSAIGYFFAQKIQENLNGVPVGIISSAWGGSAAELWAPEQVFRQNPRLADNYKKLGSSEYYPTQMSGAYNAMIFPLNPYKIKGALWYQGETNTGNAEGYTDLLFHDTILETGKRRRISFYIIQIAKYTGWGDTTVKIQNSQRIVSETVKNSGLVITSDLDRTDDIHPK